MKFFFKIIFILTIIFSIFTENKANTENEVEQFEMIEMYIKNQKKNIKNIVNKYNIKDKSLDIKVNELNNLQKIIKKIKNQDIKENQEEILKYITKNLKNINFEVKEILKYHKDIFEKNLKLLQFPYNKLGKKISDKLDIIINLIQKNKLNKQVLSLKESILKEKVQELKGISRLFRNFGDLNFSSEEEIKNKFKSMIDKTKKNIFSIKEKLKD